MFHEFKPIPGFPGYGVSMAGCVLEFNSWKLLDMFARDDYPCVYLLADRKVKSMKVHRLVAMTWVHNPNPEVNNVVNHLDGNRFNYYADNLEWTTISGNNYHAVNTGLREDNAWCKVRDYNTGIVTKFPSMAQACEFMGLKKDTPKTMLQPKMFGKLVADRFEFKFMQDESPWIYENNQERFPPARYMVIVTDDQGNKQYVFSTRDLLKFGLYKSPNGKSIPSLVEYANGIFKDKRFECIDSYERTYHDYDERNRDAYKMQISVTHPCGKVTVFDSLTKCAAHFLVDRSVIKHRIRTGEGYAGCKFTVNGRSS